MGKGARKTPFLKKWKKKKRERDPAKAKRRRWGDATNRRQRTGRKRPDYKEWRWRGRKKKRASGGDLGGKRSGGKKYRERDGFLLSLSALPFPPSRRHMLGVGGSRTGWHETKRNPHYRLSFCHSSVLPWSFSPILCAPLFSLFFSPPAAYVGVAEKKKKRAQRPGRGGGGEKQERGTGRCRYPILPLWHVDDRARPASLWGAAGPSGLSTRHRSLTVPVRADLFLFLTRPSDPEGDHQCKPVGPMCVCGNPFRHCLVLFPCRSVCWVALFPWLQEKKKGRHAGLWSHVLVCSRTTL